LAILAKIIRKNKAKKAKKVALSPWAIITVPVKKNVRPGLLQPRYRIVRESSSEVATSPA
jgi:hypothetical protein